MSIFLIRPDGTFPPAGAGRVVAGALAMSSQKLFLRGLFAMSFLMITLFGLEFLWEWERLGRPGPEALNWAGTNNAKMADVLSPMARAYNNILGMLLATIGLAIPLTANMHTPRLIEMFLRDRVNQVMLCFCCVGAAHVLWVAYLVGPGFAPEWAVRLAVYGALAGWAALIPYFFYVVRFLDPSNILGRLEERILQLIDQVRAGKVVPKVARAQISERMYQIATIIMKSIERGDRGVVVEGARDLKLILAYHSARRSQLPAEWFRVDHDDCLGLSDEAIDLLNETRTWFEHRVMTLLFTAYQAVLGKMPDVISAFSDIVRSMALQEARQRDEPALELTVRFFNNYLREAIKHKDTHALYDLFYQYRALAGEVGEYPRLQQQIAQHFHFYGEQAIAAGLAFVPTFLAFDLVWLTCTAYERRSPAAADLLEQILALDHKGSKDPRFLLVKAKVIL